MNHFSYISQGTYKKHSGMYIGIENNPNIKECKNIFITTIPKIETAYQEVIGEYVRNTKHHKAGELKTQVKYKEWKCLYSNILQAWKEIPTYPTVSYGLTCMRRDALVVDIDEYVKNIEEAERYILTKRAIQPTYIIRNPKTGHFQFGFVLKDPITAKDFHTFSLGIRQLAKIYKSDECFHGPACKNPYYIGFESKVWEDRVYSLQNFQRLINVKGSILEQSSSSASAVATQDTQKKEALICVINSPSCCCSLDNTNTNLLTSEPSEGGQLVESCIIQSASKRDLGLLKDKLKDNPSTTNRSKRDHTGWNNTSYKHTDRHLMLLRNRVFKYFRESKQKLTDKLLIQQFEQEVEAQMISEGYIFDDSVNTKSTIEHVVAWCNTKGWNNFNPNFTKTQSAAGAKKSIEVRRGKKYDKIRKFREWMIAHKDEVDLESKGKARKGKLSKKKAAILIGISYDEFRNYLKMVKEGQITIDEEIEEDDIDRERANFTGLSGFEKVPSNSKLSEDEEQYMFEFLQVV